MVAILILKTDVVVSGKDAVGAGVQLLYFAPGMVRIKHLVRILKSANAWVQRVQGAGTFIALRMIKWLRQPRWPIILAATILPIGTGFVAQALYTGNNAHIIGFMIMTGSGVGMGFGPLGAFTPL